MRSFEMTKGALQSQSQSILLRAGRAACIVSTGILQIGSFTPPLVPGRGYFDEKWDAAVIMPNQVTVEGSKGVAEHQLKGLRVWQNTS
jgi:hypothetical protein